jgi:hypothetical protein
MRFGRLEVKSLPGTDDAGLAVIDELALSLSNHPHLMDRVAIDG